MLGSFRNRRAGVLIWALMAALVVGLAGFGIGAGGGLTSSSVASVGSQQIDTDEYVRAMQQEMRALNAQIGRDADRSPRRGSTASTAWCWRGWSTTPRSTRRRRGSGSRPATTPSATR